jgi:hypothetical protein
VRVSSESGELEFLTEGGVLRLVRAEHVAESPAELAVIADPVAYQQILDFELFGLTREKLPPINPIELDRAVALTLRWRGSAPAPSMDSLSSADLDSELWQVVDVSQDFDGIQLGYRTVGPADELSSAVVDFLAADGWIASRESAEDPLTTTYEGRNGTLDVEIFTDEERRFLIALAYLPVAVPDVRVREIGELALRVSAIMDIGTVDVDLDDGSIRMRSSIDFEDAVISEALLRNAIHAAVVQGDLFVPAFVAVAEGMSALDALDLAVESLSGD